MKTIDYETLRKIAFKRRRASKNVKVPDGCHNCHSRCRDGREETEGMMICDAYSDKTIPKKRNFRHTEACKNCSIKLCESYSCRVCDDYKPVMEKTK